MEQILLEQKIARFSRNKCTKLFLSNDGIDILPDTIGNLSNLTYLNLSGNQLTILPDAIGNLSSLSGLELSENKLTELPSTIGKLNCLSCLNLCNNQLTKLPKDVCNLMHLSRLNAVNLDNWREYSLLKIDGIEAVYGEYHEEKIDSPEATLRDREAMVLLKMTCPSTQHIHILRVPPEMTSAEAAITWVNHGIHPDKIAVQT